MQRDILSKIVETQKTGKRHFIIIAVEGVGHAQSPQRDSGTHHRLAPPFWAMSSAVVLPLCVTV